MLVDWSYSGPASGVGAKARMRAKAPGRSSGPTWRSWPSTPPETIVEQASAPAAGGARRAPTRSPSAPAAAPTSASSCATSRRRSASGCRAAAAGMAPARQPRDGPLRETFRPPSAAAGRRRGAGTPAAARSPSRSARRALEVAEHALEPAHRVDRPLACLLGEHQRGGHRLAARRDACARPIRSASSAPTTRRSMDQLLVARRARSAAPAGPGRPARPAARRPGQLEVVAATRRSQPAASSARRRRMLPRRRRPWGRERVEARVDLANSSIRARRPGRRAPRGRPPRPTGPLAGRRQDERPQLGVGGQLPQGLHELLEQRRVHGGAASGRSSRTSPRRPVVRAPGSSRAGFYTIGGVLRLLPRRSPCSCCPRRWPWPTIRARAGTATDDRVVTNAGFIPIIYLLPLFHHARVDAPVKLDKRKDQRKKAAKARSASRRCRAVGSPGPGPLRAGRLRRRPHDRSPGAPQRGRRPDGRPARGGVHRFEADDEARVLVVNRPAASPSARAPTSRRSTPSARGS